MTEIFVSGTEVFSDAKMTEPPYEWRRVDMYVLSVLSMTAALCHSCKTNNYYDQCNITIPKHGSIEHFNNITV